MTEERRAGGPGDGPSRTLRRLLLGISLLLAILLSIASRTQRGGIPAGVAASDHGHLHTALQDFVTVRVESVGLEHLRVQPGGTASLQFFPRTGGRFQFACTIEGHREAGMTGILEVQ